MKALFGLLRSRVFDVFIVLGLAATGGFFWSTVRSVEALFEKNEALQRSLARLQEEEVLAYTWLLDAPGTGQLRMVWLEVPAVGTDSPEFRVLELSGTEFYGEGLVVKFPGRLVADGEGRAMLLWRRAFGSAQAPVTGVELARPGAAPERYRDWLDVEVDQGSRERFWEALWGLAHDPEELSGLGIEAVYGNAVSVRPRPGFFYTIKLSATGGLSMTTRPMREAPAEWPQGGFGKGS